MQTGQNMVLTSCPWKESPGRQTLVRGFVDRPVPVASETPLQHAPDGVRQAARRQVQGPPPARVPVLDDERLGAGKTHDELATLVHAPAGAVEVSEPDPDPTDPVLQPTQGEVKSPLDVSPGGPARPHVFPVNVQAHGFLLS
jgi:hypothetical protein